LTWTGVKTLPDEGVSMTTSFGTGARARTVTFNLYLDPTDHLLRRVEARSTIGLQQGLNITTISDVQLNPTFAPETFAFKAPTATQIQAERTYYDPKLKVGVVPYALTGADLTGKTISLPAYKGKVVLLDFWATWCGPCIGELPNVLSSYKKYKPKGFDVIGVSLDQDKTALTSFIKARQMPWPQLFDGKVWKNVNSTRYGVRAIPFTLLIGKDGKIAAVNPRGAELEPAIKKALAG
jgi:peroxiredoxin